MSTTYECGSFEHAIDDRYECCCIGTDDDLHTCAMIRSTESMENILLELEALSISTCNSEVFAYDDDGCSTPDELQTARASSYAGSAHDDFSFYVEDDSSSCNKLANADNDRWYHFSGCSVDTARPQEVYYKLDFEPTELETTTNTESVLQLYRAQRKAFSFYQLPELNTKPVDFSPRFEYVASQYQLPEMFEYAVHNEPAVARRLKQERFMAQTLMETNNNWGGGSDDNGGTAMPNSLMPTVVQSEYCYSRLCDT